MASSTDFKKIYDLYQSAGVPKGLSIVQFCKMNGIVYSHFERWYKKDRVANVVPVQIVDRDNLSNPQVAEVSSPMTTLSACVPPVQSLEIHFSNGLEIHHRQIDYRTLRSLVEKLEVLC